MKILSMKNRIMVRVLALYAIRKSKVPFVAEVSLFAIMLILLSGLVSVPSVLSNMTQSVDLPRYFIIAFSNTNSLVQVITLLCVLPLIYSLRNFGNILKLSRSNSVGRVTPS